jgi:hypothetical protein
MSEQMLGLVAFGALLAIAIVGYVVSSSSAIRLHGRDGMQGRDAALRA